LRSVKLLTCPCRLKDFTGEKHPDQLVLRTVKLVAKSRAKDRTPEGDDFPF
jgi:hypothetical protein